MSTSNAAMAPLRTAGTRATSFVILVDFDIDPEARSRFLDLVRENAALSVRNEPDCFRFDVLTARDPARRNIITLYEIYTDEAAFQAHLASRHFLEFDAASRDMVLNKTVYQLDVEENAK